MNNMKIYDNEKKKLSQFQIKNWKIFTNTKNNKKSTLFLFLSL